MKYKCNICGILRDIPIHEGNLWNDKLHAFVFEYLARSNDTMASSWWWDQIA